MKHLFLFILFIGLLSCKKKNDEQICPTPYKLEPPIPNVLLKDIKANGFFVFQKYYTISGNITQYDSSYNYAGVTLPSTLYTYIQKAPYSFFGSYGYLYLKVNSIDYSEGGYFGFEDVTNSNITAPRHIDFMGDNYMRFNFDTINYIDNTAMPSYTDVNVLPDSVQLNKTFTLNIGTRRNTIESNLYFGVGTAPIKWCYLPNSTSSLTIPYYDIQDYGMGYNSKFQLVLRNWTYTTINNRKYYVICEHIYTKKIKLYN